MPAPSNGGFWSFDGKQLFFKRMADYWRLSMDDHWQFPVTNFAGRRGTLGVAHTDGKYFYFTWRDDLADVWTVDLTEQ